MQRNGYSKGPRNAPLDFLLPIKENFDPTRQGLPFAQAISLQYTPIN